MLSEFSFLSILNLCIHMYMQRKTFQRNVSLEFIFTWSVFRIQDTQAKEFYFVRERALVDTMEYLNFCKTYRTSCSSMEAKFIVQFN